MPATSLAPPLASSQISIVNDEKSPQHSTDDIAQHEHTPCEDDASTDEYSPDDPELPLNWPARKEWRALLLVATLTFLTCVSNTPEISLLKLSATTTC